MEGIESRSRNEGGLVGDPEVLDRVKGVGKNDTSVPQPGLEDWPAVFLGPFCRHSCMVLSELQEIAKDWDTGDFGQALDLWLIGRIEVLDEEVSQGQYYKREGRR